MTCGRVANQLSAYIDRELSGAEMLSIRRHLSDCAGCTAEYEALCRIKMALVRLRAPEPGPDFVRAAVRRFETRVEREHSWPLRLMSSPPLTARGVRRAGPPPPLARLCSCLTPLAGRVPWPRLTVCLTTAALAAALVFTSVGLLQPRHADALVATNDIAVVQGVDPHESEVAGDWHTVHFSGFDRSNRHHWGRLLEPQPYLPWTPASFDSQGWRGFP